MCLTDEEESDRQILEEGRKKQKIRKQAEAGGRHQIQKLIGGIREKIPRGHSGRRDRKKKEGRREKPSLWI